MIKKKKRVIIILVENPKNLFDNYGQRCHYDGKQISNSDKPNCLIERADSFIFDILSVSVHSRPTLRRGAYAM